MSNNAFSGIIDEDIHCLYDDMINALLENKALTTCAELSFGNCKFVDCDNCDRGKYVPGGPLYFPSGKLCPLCFGKGKDSIEEKECIWLCTEFESRGWVSNIGRDRRSANISSLQAETMCSVEHYNKLVSCDYIVLDKCNECYCGAKFKRIGKPQFCGLGRKSFILVFWESF